MFVPMRSSRALALIALGGWFVFACGSSREPGMPSGSSASSPDDDTPAAVPDPTASPAAPSAAAPGAAAPGNDTPAAVTGAAEPSSEAVGGDLPIASEPNAAEPAGGGEGASGEGASQGEAAEGGADGEGSIDGHETPVPPPGKPERSAITIWIAGDSTVANGNTPCPRGWGGVFAPHFNDLVTVNNSAVGGRSVHTWLYDVQTVLDETGECALTRDASGEPTLQPRWQAMLDGMKPGDYLFIQFGINDGDPTCERHVGIDAFTTAYGMMAAAAKERGANPIFLTPVSSISCDGASARGSRGGFVPATLQAGEQFDVPVIDLHARSVALYQEHGFCPVAGGDVSATTSGPVGDFFCDDHTHFSATGAVEIADVVVQALIDQQIPLAAYLR
jgi:lysophospholipase L1-like esterase